LYSRLKLGYPQVAGLNLEYVTPLLSKRLTADIDLSYLPLNSPVFEVTAINNGVAQTESFSSPISGGGPIADIGFGFSF
jgi:hypothetical protein